MLNDDIFPINFVFKFGKIFESILPSSTFASKDEHCFEIDSNTFSLNKQLIYDSIIAFAFTLELVGFLNNLSMLYGRTHKDFNDLMPYFDVVAHY